MRSHVTDVYAARVRHLATEPVLDGAQPGQCGTVYLYTNDVPTKGHLMLRTLLATLAVTTIIGGTAATAVEAAQGAQPYGGCKEAYRYVASAGAQDCRDAGWLITKRLVVGPKGYVHMSRLPHCEWEDGGENQPCTWNLGPGKDGNGKGLTYWIDREDRTHYLNGWAHRTLVTTVLP